MEQEPLLTSPTTTTAAAAAAPPPLLRRGPDFSSQFRSISLPPPPSPTPPPPPPPFLDTDFDIEEIYSSIFIPQSQSQDHDYLPLSSAATAAAGPSSTSSSHDALLPTIKRKKIQRCKTAPAMAIMAELLKQPQHDDNQLQNPNNHHQDGDETKPPQSPSASLVRQTALFLILYLTLGILIYSFNRDHFSGIETHPVVDALYFCIVTMCTIGYGDIAPLSPVAKLFACFFVLVGFGFIDILLSGVVNYVLDLQENILLHGIQHQFQYQYQTQPIPSKNNSNNKKKKAQLLAPPPPAKAAGIFSASNYIFDFAKGRMRIRLKVGLALGVVVFTIGIGTLVLYSVEDLDFIDSLYLSVMSVTTVGYGDRAFKTLPGRLFASVWLLFSTLAVAHAFLYLAEARIDKRHRKINNWVLHRQITIDDLLAADLNHNGFISKSEYVVFKLKEMGKVAEKDISQICDQFNKLDRNNHGKITLPDLLESRLQHNSTL